jgi:exodeoxyribonuclease V gamma subunit
MAAQPLPGDRDPREEDRQLFLDALISASERVIITAPTRHVVTDKDLPFSVCVDELLRCAEITVAQDAAGRALVRPILVPRHPLQPFARANFAPPGSFDTASRNLGLAMEAPRSEPEPFFKRGRAVALETDPEILTVDVLHAFFCDPAKVWLQGLKLRLPKEGGSKERDEDPMDPPADLREWQIRDAGITQALLQASPKARRRALDTLVADRVLSYGELGQAQARKILEGVEAAVDPILQAGGVQRQLFEADLEPRLVGELSVAEHGKTLALVTASNLTKGKTLLKSWLHVALAAAAGKPLPLLRVGADDRRKVVRDRLPAEQVSKAKKALQTLAHLRQEGLSEPLAFELDLSLELALEIRAALAEQRPLRPGIADAWEEQLEKNACLALAWRDRDPFKGKGLARWKEIASAVWDPVLDWQEAAGGEHA